MDCELFYLCFVIEVVFSIVSLADEDEVNIVISECRWAEFQWPEWLHSAEYYISF